MTEEEQFQWALKESLKEQENQSKDYKNIISIDLEEPNTFIQNGLNQLPIQGQSKENVPLDYSLHSIVSHIGDLASNGNFFFNI